MKYGISNKKGNKSVYCTAPKTLYVYEEKLRKEFNGDFTILIPNCMDGYSVLPLLRKNHYVDCYEMNNILIDGGYINNFYTRGLLAKVRDEELNDRMNLYKKNFYDNRISKQYNFVYSYRSLHLQENSEIPMYRKIRKLQSSVKDGGYIYLFYYIADDEKDYDKYPSNSYLRTYEMKKYFDRDNWEIIYSVENHIREYSPNIFNNKIHTHKTGTLFAKKKHSRRKLRYKYTYNLY